MKLAFCLFKYFPFGGLQRDFLRIALRCQQQGHEIYVYTMDWQGEIPAGFNVTVIPVAGITNHRRCQRFAQAITKLIQTGNFDRIIGFNRLPGLDIYFAGDLCYEAVVQQRYHGLARWFYRFTPRYRIYAALEKGIFETSAKTHILLISKYVQKQYQDYYHTQAERFYLLPPGIAEDRRPLSNNNTVRNEVRNDLHIPTTNNLILMVGSSYDTKGVDRSLFALASLPAEVLNRTSLVIIGEGKAAPYLKMAKQLSIADKVHFLGPRYDIPRFLWAADMLLHPSYFEAGGMVLLEALVSGLPVLVTANCGYAYHIEQAKAGIVIDIPFQQTALNAGLLTMLTSPERLQWRENALRYAGENDFYRFAESAVKVIEDY